MRTVSGKPRLGTIHDLLTQAVILRRPAGLRREREDRLLVRRALLEPYALGDDGLEHFRPEHLVYLRADVPGQGRPLVVHGDHYAEDVQVRVGPAPHFLDG